MENPGSGASSATPAAPGASPRSLPLPLWSGAGWLRIVLALGMLAGIRASWPLWISDRFYPLSPLLPGIAAPAPPWDRVLAIALVALLIATIVDRRAIPLVLALGAVLCLIDQSRLQPWFYEYAAMLAALFLGRGEDDPDVVATLRLILAATYFWSGLHKLNPGFREEIYPFLLAAATDHPPAIGAYLMPLGETALGVLLLLPRTRRWAVVGAVAMHATILALLGPWGRDHNSVIWPWNVAHALLVVMLFRDRTQLLGLRRFAPYRVAALLFAALPAASFVGLWDLYLSAGLYSGKELEATLYFPHAVAQRFDDELYFECKPHSLREGSLPVAGWSFSQLNVPAYPARRVLLNVARRICSYADPADLRLVLSRPGFEEEIPGPVLCAGP